MIFNTKRCKEDRVTKNKVAEKYLGTVARCHGGDKVVERGRVAKKKLRWRRRDFKACKRLYEISVQDS